MSETAMHILQKFPSKSTPSPSRKSNYSGKLCKSLSNTITHISLYESSVSERKISSTSFFWLCNQAREVALRSSPENGRANHCECCVCLAGLVFSFLIFFLPSLPSAIFFAEGFNCPARISKKPLADMCTRIIVGFGGIVILVGDDARIRLVYPNGSVW